jgi:hypothetical protein
MTPGGTLGCVRFNDLGITCYRARLAPGAPAQWGGFFFGASIMIICRPSSFGICSTTP